METPDMLEAKRERQTRTVYEHLIGAMLTPIKSQKKAWKSMSELDQDALLAQFDDMLRTAVREAIDLVAADEMPHIKVTLEKVTFAEGVTGTISMPNTDGMRHRLSDAARKQVLVIIPDYDAHMQGERPKAEPEQASLEYGPGTVKTWGEEDVEYLAAQRDEGGLYRTLVENGFVNANEEVIASWTLEQITAARAFIRGESDTMPPVLAGLT